MTYNVPGCGMVANIEPSIGQRVYWDPDIQRYTLEPAIPVGRICRVSDGAFGILLDGDYVNSVCAVAQDDWPEETP